MRHTLSAILLASALGAAPITASASAQPATTGHSTPAFRFAALATLTTRGAALPLMVADAELSAAADSTDYAATPAVPGDESATPATPSNTTAYQETQEQRPDTAQDADADTARPDVDSPEVERPEVDRPTVERPEVEHPQIGH